MVEKDSSGVDVGFMKPGMLVHVELHFTVVYDHGWGLYAELPADLSTVLDVGTECICFGGLLEYE